MMFFPVHIFSAMKQHCSKFKLTWNVQFISNSKYCIWVENHYFPSLLSHFFSSKCSPYTTPCYSCSWETEGEREGSCDVHMLSFNDFIKCHSERPVFRQAFVHTQLERAGRMSVSLHKTSRKLVSSNRLKRNSSTHSAQMFWIHFSVPN